MRFAAPTVPAVVALTLLAACGGRNGTVESFDPSDAPPLPAPVSGSYARVIDEPVDPLVAQALQGRAWEASLSGAAAGLALGVIYQGAGFSRFEVREALWRAGYPYPVRTVAAWDAPRGAPPSELVAWLQALPEQDDLGLVRARGPEGELWVALAASPRGSVGVQPRHRRIGESLTLRAVPGARFQVVDPHGNLAEGSLDDVLEHELNRGGEWLVQVDDAQGVVARFPVYVGIQPPETPWFDMGTPVSDVGEALRRASRRLEDLHAVHRLEPWERDGLLDSAARSALRDPERDPLELMDRVGMVPVDAWRCQGATPEACLDQVIWNPIHREALLSVSSTSVGLAADQDDQGVQLVVLIGRE